jgi:hypothetical protein
MTNLLGTVPFDAKEIVLRPLRRTAIPSGDGVVTRAIAPCAVGQGSVLKWSGAVDDLVHGDAIA